MTTKEIETVMAAAEAAKNWPLLWLCEGALLGDLGCLAKVRKTTNAPR